MRAIGFAGWLSGWELASQRLIPQFKPIRRRTKVAQQVMDFNTHADSGYMPGAGITGPAGAAAGGAAAAASLAVNVAATGVKGVTSSTGYMADKTANQIVDQVSAYYTNHGWGV